MTNFNNRVLVTGGAGFIGSHTVDLLLQQGYRVTVFDNLVTGKLSNLDLFHSNLTVIQADVLQYDRLLQEIKRADCVLHLAALASVPQSIEHPVESLKVNALGFLHVLEAIREAQKQCRLVYASSAAVYGASTQLPCNDEAPLVDLPLSPYAFEKMSNEQYASLYERLFGIKSLGLRYFNVYGPRQDPASPYSGVISRFLSLAQKNEPIIVFGDGKQSRDFVFVGDIARANVAALQNTVSGVMNIATGDF